MPFLRAFLTLAGLAALMAACGTRGPLTLPPKADPVDHSSSPQGGRQ